MPVLTKTIAVLATDGFEQSELEKPVEALKAAGATVEVVSPKQGQIQGWEHQEKGRPLRSIGRWPRPIPPATTPSFCRAG